MSARVRLALFWAFVALVVAGTAGYFLWRSRELGRGAARERRATPRPGGASLGSLAGVPRIYYRSSRDGEFGRVVVAALEALETRRFVSDLHCERVHVGGEHGVCVRDNHGELHPPALASFFDRELRVLTTVPLVGAPSRARMSPNGHWAATTVFVTGDSYEADFSTRTNLFELDEPTPRNLEWFDAKKDGKPFRGEDFNYWGVTFARDSNTFYATLGTGGQRYLVQGDAQNRTLRVLRPNAECPSLSPDQRQVAYKLRAANGRDFSLRVLELATGTERAVPTLGVSVDDQVEWLDDQHLLYGLVAERGLPSEAVNVWLTSVVPGDAAPPRLYLRGASSPAVVR